MWNPNDDGMRRAQARYDAQLPPEYDEEEEEEDYPEECDTDMNDCRSDD